MGEVQAPEKELPLAAQIMDRVRKRFRTPMELVLALEKEGIINRGSGQRYDPSSVSSWARGASAVPGEVLLTAARLAEVSVDEYLFGEAGKTDKKDRERLERLEARHEQDIQKLREEFREMLRAEALSLREELRNLGKIGRGHMSDQLDEGQPPT